MYIYSENEVLDFKLVLYICIVQYLFCDISRLETTSYYSGEVFARELKIIHKNK